MMRTWNRLDSLSERWSVFWLASVPPHIYATLRIALGAIGCFDLLAMSDIQTYWMPEGIAGSSPSVADLIEAFPRTAAAVGPLLLLGSMIAFGSMTVGLRSRTSTAAAFLASLARLAWTPMPLSAAHHLLHALLFCLLWAEAGAVWSIDDWRRRQRHTGGVSVLPLRLMQFQMCLLYATSGLWKAIDPLWLRGEALYWVFMGNVYTRFPETLPGWLEAVAMVVTYTVLVWELAFPVLVMHRRLRKLALGLGVVLHSGMALTMELGVFSLVVISGYLVFLDPEGVAHRFSRAESSPVGAPVEPANEPTASSINT